MNIDPIKLDALLGRALGDLGAQAGEARLAELARANGFSSFRGVVQTPFNMVFEARR